MLALCADGALGRYAPYGRESVAPIRGGIDGIWRAFPNAVPNFRVKVIELIPAEGNIVVIQAEMSGPIPRNSSSDSTQSAFLETPHSRLQTTSTQDMRTRSRRSEKNVAGPRRLGHNLTLCADPPKCRRHVGRSRIRDSRESS